MTTAAKVLEEIKEQKVAYVDFRFTDPRGKWQHVALSASAVDESVLEDGAMFDGSSIAGWKAINESDMCLKPDLTYRPLNPFTAQPQMILFCDVLEPTTRQPYDRDPRSTAKKAVNYLRSSGIGDQAFMGPEAEFFVFDSVRFASRQEHCFYRVDSEEGPYNSGTDYEQGNIGHRPVEKGGYFPVPPVDSGEDLRAEMLSTMQQMGIAVEKHHHEVAPSQHELGTRFQELCKAADFLQVYKFVVQSVAHSYGKTATFMPKPVYADNGSGMHVHQSIWKGNRPIFAGNGYAGLSEECLHYIGGIVRHARALNAFTNPTTNSYKRLVPGFEAPVLLAYSSRNRSAACRIPFGEGPGSRRVEVRFPDPSANPYLAFSAMLMAGLDGIRNKVDPGDPIDKNLYDLPPQEQSGVETVSSSLRQALRSLQEDRDFLLHGDVFTSDQIDAYLELKWQEVERFETTPHPVEFQMYYSV